tara:strand:- start:285 stop:1424 length:1140 start_codon:yes stop_codon:yes gene_type:complete
MAHSRDNLRLHTLQQAYCATQTGDFDTAQNLAKQILHDDPGNLSALHIYFDSTKINDGDPIFSNLQNFCKNDALADDIRSQLFFMLGKGFADHTQYADAFDAFVTANKLAKKHSNPNAVAALSKALVTQVSTLKIPALEPRQPRMIFILGMPRSGTSIMAQSLSNHSDIVSLGENTGLGGALQSVGWTDLSLEALPAFFHGLTAETLLEIRAHYIASITVPFDPHATVLVDKMPENYWFAWVIPLLFPNAQIVHMTRPPLANCWSCFRHDFKDGHHYSYDFKTMMAHYAIYAEMVTHWRARTKDGWFEMPLDEFVSDPRASLEPIINGVDLAWQDACLSPEKNETAVSTLSKWQVRQGLDRKISREWENYLPFIRKAFL